MSTVTLGFVATTQQPHEALFSAVFSRCRPLPAGRSADMSGVHMSATAVRSWHSRRRDSAVGAAAATSQQSACRRAGPPLIHPHPMTCGVAGAAAFVHWSPVGDTRSPSRHPRCRAAGTDVQNEVVRRTCGRLHRLRPPRRAPAVTPRMPTPGCARRTRGRAPARSSTPFPERPRCSLDATGALDHHIGRSPLNGLGTVWTPPPTRGASADDQAQVPHAGFRHALWHDG